MQKSLQDKVALITGASSGIGAATARSFLECGARVVVSARRIERLCELGATLGYDDRQYLPLEGDVTAEVSAEQLVVRTLEWSNGELDVLVNNAGLSRGGMVQNNSVAEIELMLQTNIFGLVNMTRLALPALKKSKGDIVNISSVAAKSPVPGSAVYSSTKAAVSNFSEALRKELVEDGVRVIAICPGFVETEFFDNAAPEKRETLQQAMARIGPLKPKDLAEVITFAVTRPSHVSLNDIVVRPTKQAV